MKKTPATRSTGERQISLRWRLAAWYAVALAAGLALFAVAAWSWLAHDLYADVDRHLAHALDSVEKFVAVEAAEPGVSLREELEEYAQALPAGTSMLLKDERGAVVFASQRPSGRSYRVLTREVRVRGRVWQVEVSESLDAIEAMLGRLRWLLVALIPGIVAVGSLGGLWLSRRALKPVDEITAAARAIGISSLSERLAVPNTGDELARLAETWNGMLARLEDAVKRLSRFSADASHELRTPLAVIRTTAEIAGRRSRGEDAYREALAQIVSESERMTGLV